MLLRNRTLVAVLAAGLAPLACSDSGSGRPGQDFVNGYVRAVLDQDGKALWALLSRRTQIRLRTSAEAMSARMAARPELLDALVGAGLKNAGRMSPQELAVALLKVKLKESGRTFRAALNRRDSLYGSENRDGGRLIVRLVPEAEQAEMVLVRDPEGWKLDLGATELRRSR